MVSERVPRQISRLLDEAEDASKSGPSYESWSDVPVAEVAELETVRRARTARYTQ